MFAEHVGEAGCGWWLCTREPVPGDAWCGEVCYRKWSVWVGNIYRTQGMIPVEVAGILDADVTLQSWYDREVNRG